MFSDLRYAMYDVIYEKKKFEPVEKVRRMKDEKQENNCN